MTNRRHVTAALALSVVLGVFVSFVAAGVAGATPPARLSSAKAKAVAALVIFEPGVSVRRKGNDEFKPATDGQKLRVGDTVQTDGTGFAQVSYTDDSFTRLDVNTTFTIESLTDDVGNRKIKTSVESGRTWNRTSALTESESFEEEGAGATAAVVGSAFWTSCVSANNCLYISIDDGLQLKTVDGEVQFLNPLDGCSSNEVAANDANLCNVPEHVALQVLLADAFFATNYFLDASLGLPLPVVPVTGTVEIDESGNVTFTPAPPPPGETPPPPPAPPTVGDEPINIVSPPPAGNASEIVTDDQTNVSFIFNAPGATYIQFTDKPLTQVGKIFVGVLPDFGNCASACINLGTQYLPSETFWFVPEPIDYPDTGPNLATFEFVAGNPGGQSAPTTVDITVNDAGDSCALGEEVATAC